MVFVHFVGDAALESDSRKLRGAGQPHFDVAGAVFSKEGKLASRERLDGAQFLGDDAGDAAYWRFFLLTCFPRARHGVSQVEALHGVGEVTHEIAAARLAESFMAISRTSAIFCARSFPRKRSVGPAIPTAATTRFSASRTGAATPLSPLSSS